MTGVTGSSLPIDYVKITALNSIAGLQEFNTSEIEDMKLSPNPASEMINVDVELDFAQTLHYEVVDILGRSMLNNDWETTEGNNTLQLDISTLRSGTYFIKIVDADGDIMVDRFLKVN